MISSPVTKCTTGINILDVDPTSFNSHIRSLVFGAKAIKIGKAKRKALNLIFLPDSGTAFWKKKELSVTLRNKKHAGEVVPKISPFNLPI